MSFEKCSCSYHTDVEEQDRLWNENLRYMVMAWLGVLFGIGLQNFVLWTALFLCALYFVWKAEVMLSRIQRHTEAMMKDIQKNIAEAEANRKKARRVRHEI